MNTITTQQPTLAFIQTLLAKSNFTLDDLDSELATYFKNDFKFDPTHYNTLKSELNLLRKATMEREDYADFHTGIDDLLHNHLTDYFFENCFTKFFQNVADRFLFEDFFATASTNHEDLFDILKEVETFSKVSQKFLRNQVASESIRSKTTNID